MNENISWGKVVVLVVAIAGIGALGFVVGRKNDETAVAPIVTPPSTQKKPVEQTKVVDEMIKMETNIFESKKYGYSVRYAEKYEGQTGYDDTTRKSRDERFFSVIDNNIERKFAGPEYDNRAIFQMSVTENFLRNNSETFKNPDEWVKYQQKIGMDWLSANINGRSVYAMNSDGFQDIPEKLYTFFVPNVNQGYDKYSITLRGENNFSEGEKILATLQVSAR